jgi:hypothetical protein
MQLAPVGVERVILEEIALQRALEDKGKLLVRKMLAPCEASPSFWWHSRFDRFRLKKSSGAEPERFPKPTTPVAGLMRRWDTVPIGLHCLCQYNFER